MPKEFLNDKPFEYRCNNGFLFTSDRCDFKHAINVPMVLAKHPQALAQSVAEMIAYHAINIWPNLNGFQGYDCLTFNNLPS